MRILLSILSDYLQPNFLLIKEMEGHYDELVFVSTPEMEKKEKGVHLEKALNLEPNSIKRIITTEDDFKTTTDTLFSQLPTEEGTTYIVNITGGTKLLSLALYEYLKNKNATFYYIPIGKNTIRNIDNTEIEQLSYRMNLKEYLTLSGLGFESDNRLIHTATETEGLFGLCKDKGFNMSRITKIKNAHEQPTAEDKRYYSGTWFEEYCYNRLKKELKLDDKFICKSAKIFRKGSETNDNEIDIMFMKENLLYMAECKVTTFGKFTSPKDTIEEYLYKLAAIAKDFGLRVNSFLLTLQDTTKMSPESLKNLKKRMKILGIKDLIDCNRFSMNEHLLAENKDVVSIKTPIHNGEEKLPSTPSFVRTEVPKLNVKILGKIKL